MNSIFDQLGINWQLFLSQAVNFFILLVILRMFVYKPLLLVIKKRQAKIQEGLQKATEADVRLKEVDGIAKDKLKKADQEALQIIHSTEQRAEVLQQSLQQKAEARQKELMAQAELAHQRQQEEIKKLVYGQAVELVKKAIIKTVELKPEIIDEALIKKAISHTKEHEA